VKTWVWLMVGFNVFDVVSTVFVVSTSIGQELNPLVLFLYGLHPIVWVATKFSLVLIGSLAVLDRSSPNYLRLTYKAVAVFYGLLSLYQLVALIHLKG